MANHVQVILMQDVENLGKAGDVVKVKPGYARNYLIPRTMAANATRGSIARIKHERAVVISRLAKLKKSAEAIAHQLNKVQLKVAKPAGEDDKLYGSVTAREIAALLQEKGYDIDRKKLILPGTIKQLGEFEISVKLGSEISANFKLLVEKQE